KQAISVPAAELISAVEAVTQLLSTGALPAISSSAKRGESDILHEPGSGAPMLEAAVVEAPMLDGPMLDGRALDRPMAADSTSAALPEAADPGTAETAHAQQMSPQTGGEAVTPLSGATQEHI